MLRVSGEEDYLPKSRNYDQSYVSMMHHKNWSCSDFGAWRFPQHFLSADFFNIFLDRSIESRLFSTPSVSNHLEGVAIPHFCVSHYHTASKRRSLIWHQASVGDSFGRNKSEALPTFIRGFFFWIVYFDCRL